MFFSAAATGGETPLPAFVIRLTIFFLSFVALWRCRGLSAAGISIDLPAMFFLLYAVLSTGWAAYPWAAYQHAMNYLCIGLTYLMLRFSPLVGDGEREANRVMAVVLAAAAAQAAYAICQYHFQHAARPAGSFANPNFLAGYLFFGAAASIHFAVRSGSVHRTAWNFLCFALVALFGYGIYLTRSRAMLPVAGGVLLFLVFSVRKGKILWLAGAGGGAALLLGAVGSRFSTAVDPYALGRLYIWKAAWKTVLAHPLGVGLGGFKFFWYRYRDPIENAVFRYGRTADTAHSQFFGILSELGFPGTLLVLAAAGAILYLLWRESRREDRILALCAIPLGGMIHAFFDVTLNVYAIALPVAACTALLAGRNRPTVGEGVRISPVHRGGGFLILVLCVLYSTATYLGQANYQGGKEFLKGGKTNAAQRDFSLARRIDPLCSAYPDAVSSVHYRWYLQTRRLEYLAAAVNAEQEAHNASPEDPYHLSQSGFLLGELSYAAPNEGLRLLYREYALAALRDSLGKDPYNMTTLLRIADIHRKWGNMRDARATLERIVAIEPNAARAYFLLAELESGDAPRTAAEHYRKSMDLSRRFAGMPLKNWEKEMSRVDGEEAARRMESLEKGQIPSLAGAQ